MDEWRDQVRRELSAAREAREGKNEGRARVCARRAAGIAAREYLASHGQPPRGSAYDLLQRLSTLPELDPQAKESALYLTLRVDEDFKLPEGVDLIAESRRLCLALHPGIDL